MFDFLLKSSLNRGYGHMEEMNQARSTILDKNGHM